MTDNLKGWYICHGSGIARRLQECVCIVLSRRLGHNFTKTFWKHLKPYPNFAGKLKAVERLKSGFGEVVKRL